MQTDIAARKVGELVTERPGRSEVFDRFGVDYCCGGKLTIAEVCARKGIEPASLLHALNTFDTMPRASAEIDWSGQAIGELITHILTTHHDYLHAELPRLAKLISKTASVHGKREPALLKLWSEFSRMASDLESHMAKEERVLFPMMRQLEQATTMPNLHCGSVNNPIRVMQQEHEDAGAALAKMRELAKGYRPPEDACNTWRAMLDGLERFEKDMHQHVHLENNVLYPRATELEARLCGE